MIRSSLLALAACVTPAMPTPATPGPERFVHAADPEAGVRARAADELVGDPSGQAATMLLVLEQRDIDPQVRGAAARAIAERRDPTLDHALEESAARDPDPAVRAEAAAAHERLWPWGRSVHTAMGLSMLCPGCGQLYLHDTGGGLAILGSTVLLAGSGIALISGQRVELGDSNESVRAPIGLLLVEAAQNLWFYSIFDAYRQSRVLRGDFGYRHAITRETLPELASAPFRPCVLASPWVWAGVPLALGAGLAVSYAAGGGFGGPSIFDVHRVNFFGYSLARAPGFAAGAGYYAALFAPVGVGEESLFRGLIQTELEERFGTYGGLAAASAIFGAAHLVNFGQDPKQALYAVPAIAILGSSLGLAYIHNDYRLSTSVAMHFWYDFLLSAVSFAADPEHQPFVVQYGSTM